MPFEAEHPAPEIQKQRWTEQLADHPWIKRALLGTIVVVSSLDVSVGLSISNDQVASRSIIDPAQVCADEACIATINNLHFPNTTPSVSPTTPETAPAPPTTTSTVIKPPVTTTSSTEAPAQVHADADGLPIKAAPLKPGSRGVDVSYPDKNCASEIPDGLDFGIAGINGGRPFTVNSCLTTELARFQKHGLRIEAYINTAYPGSSVASQYLDSPDNPDDHKNCDPSDINCLAYLYGYHAGMYAAQQANEAGIQATMIWLDVETANAWTYKSVEMGIKPENRWSLLGHIAGFRSAYQQKEVTFGVYSTKRLWKIVVGNDTWVKSEGWPDNDLAMWLAPGVNNLDDAVPNCHGPSFKAAGKLVYVQFVQDLDNNVAC